mgnify:CR=1 FL=1
MHTNPHLYAGLPDDQKKRILIKNKPLSNDALFKAIFKALNVTKEQIQSKTRKSEIVTARYIFIGLQKELGQYLPLKEIGKLVGGRDHSTVIYAIDTFNDMVETKNIAFNIALNKVRKEIGNG